MRLARLLSSLASFSFPAVVLANSGGPLPALTGGFKERTCVQCHTSFPLNEGRTRGGVFQLDGVPKTYRGGASYPITVVIGQPGQSRWGFELAVRHVATGAQAGRLAPGDGMTQVKESGGIQYIVHTTDGTRQGTGDGPVEFKLNWIAPDPQGGPVYFNAAGNAANSSGEPTGDFIYTAGGFSAAGEGGPPLTSATPAGAGEKPFERLNTGTRLLHLPAPKRLPKGALIFTVQHRFLGALADAGPSESFGLDQGANINLELMYTPVDRLTVGVSRARFAFAGRSFAPKIITWTGSYALHDSKESPWHLAAVGGVEGQQNFTTQYSPFLQLSAAYDFKRLRAFVVPTAVFNSRDDEALKTLGSFAIHPRNNHTFSLGVGADLALTSRISLAGEYVPRLAGFGGFGEKHPTVAAGFNIYTWRHVFSIIFSSSRDFTPARYALNAEKEFVLGFNIYRRIR